MRHIIDNNDEAFIYIEACEDTVKIIDAARHDGEEDKVIEIWKDNIPKLIEILQGIELDVG